MIGAISSEGTEALRSYGENVGMAFQVIDDILDFTGDEEELGKPVGSDLLQGTLTLPALLLMERQPDDNPIKRMFANERPQEHLAEALAAVQNSDVLDESREVARDFRDRAVSALDPLADTPPRSALIDIADHILGRRS